MTKIPAFLSHALLGCAALFSAAPALSDDDDGDNGQWRKIVPTAAVMGADGKMHKASCSGYPGLDKTFSFWTKKGSSKNLMVFFEGGGACWDNYTCTFPSSPAANGFYTPALDPSTNPATFDGVFKSDNRHNPVRDWSVVYIPYCTGDLHVGSASKNYFSAGYPGFPLGTPFQIEHRGFDNFMVVLDWMKKNVDKPKNMLVTGVSAGGYGASLNFPWLARAYPKAKLNVVADASQGVTVPAFDVAATGRNSWNPQFAPWIFGNTPPTAAGSELLRVATRAYPEAKVAQFTTAFDDVQIFFYGAMKQLYGDAGNCANPGVDWYQQMSTTLVSYANTLPNYRYYVAGGQYHTIVSSPSFYTEASGGVAFSEWLDDMLESRGGRKGHGGGDWRNSACPNCLVNLPCPP